MSKKTSDDRLFKYIVAIGLLCLLGSFVFQHTSFKKVHESPAYKNTKDNIIYYGQLVRACKEKSVNGCCITSVNRMRANTFRKMTEKGCPEGYRMNSLQCSGSYKWCEKKDEK